MRIIIYNQHLEKYVIYYVKKKNITCSRGGINKVLLRLYVYNDSPNTAI